MTDDGRISEIRARHRPTTIFPYENDPFCMTCLDEGRGGDDGSTWPCDYGILLAERDALEAAARHAIAGLADDACPHGPEFDANERWGGDCSVCEAMYPLVVAITRTDTNTPTPSIPVI